MTPPKIVIENLSKHFDKDGESIRALENASLSVRSGSFSSIVGPSGCGKSTLLYILGGFVRDFSGSVLVDGIQVTGPGVDRGIVFQDYALFPWLNVFENIAYGLRRKGVPPLKVKDTVYSYIELMHLRGFERHFPRELSGGMRQRVALARTFACDPDILLLDEPFGALDAQTREIMQDELLRLWRDTKKTVVMVTHDINESVYLSDRVFVMSRRPGHIVQGIPIGISRQGSREDIVLSAEYTQIYQRVWIAVREQVKLAQDAL